MAVDMQRLKMFTECAICLDAFDNPKQLHCNHTFCKTCLEEILHFQQDGSATITCPMKCDVETLISAQKTVNHLPVSYEFKSILEVLRTSAADAHPGLKCECTDACASGVSMYCCGDLMCDGCFNAHEKNSAKEVHRKKRRVGFDRKGGKVKVLCDEHSTYCTELCVDGDFLCMYCLARNDDRKRRHKNSIETEVELLREAITSDMKRNRSILEFRQTTQNTIEETRNKMMTSLEQRRKECIAQYVEFIGKEMELLKSKFERICTDHLRQYPDNLDIDYHDKKLHQNDVVLAIEKDGILNTILENRNETTLHTETVSFSMDINFLSTQPLGDIQVIPGEAVVIDEVPLSTLISDIHKINLQSPSCSDTPVHQHHHLDEKSARSEASGTTSRTSVSSQCSSKPRRAQPSASSLQKSSGKTYRQAYLDIGIGDEVAGRIIIDLFFDKVPKTCKHFVQLCTHSHGCGYKGSKFSNISPWNGYCEGGDIAPIAGNIPCENYLLEHDCRGILSMANCNDFVVSSKFFITSKSKPEWNGSHVVFGRVTGDTYGVVEKMMKVKTFGAFFGGMPLTDVVILDSGIL